MKKTLLTLAMLSLSAMAVAQNYAPNYPAAGGGSSGGSSGISGTIASGQVAYGSPSSTITGTNGFTYDPTTMGLTISTTRVLSGAGATTNASVFIGNGTGNTTQTGTRNTAVGSIACQSLTSGGSNTCYGWNALSSLTTGGNNVAVGTAALSSINVGSNNVSIGNNSGSGMSGSASSNIFIGNGTTGLVTSNGSNQLNIGNSIYGLISSGTGNNNLIGINTNSPTAGLDVSGTVKIGPCSVSQACNAANTGEICRRVSNNTLYQCNGAASFAPVQYGTLVSNSGLN